LAAYSHHPPVAAARCHDLARSQTIWTQCLGTRTGDVEARGTHLEKDTADNSGNDYDVT